MIALLLTVTAGVVATRVGTVALASTGLSEDIAHFQARSAFSGVGYTTEEAESIVAHPGRRRIVLVLMLFSNAGIATVIATLVLGLSGSDLGTLIGRLAVLSGGLAGLWLLTANRWLQRRTRGWIEVWLRRFTDLEVRDYVELLRVEDEYEVRELDVEEGSWLDGGSLGELGLAEEGVVVLGVRRSDGSFLAAPTGATELVAGDTMLCYGRTQALRELAQRKAGPGGERAHDEAVAEQERIETEEEAADAAS